MSPQQAIIEALAALDDDEVISVRELGARCGVKGIALSGALQSLRNAGKVRWDCVALTPSMRVASARVEPVPDVPAVPETPVSTPERLQQIADQVAHEAREAATNRLRARTTGGGTQRLGTISVEQARTTFDGGDLQRLAITTPAEAAQALKAAWSDTWNKLCDDARANGVRPIPHLVALIERGIEAGCHVGLSLPTEKGAD